MAPPNLASIREFQQLAGGIGKTRAYKFCRDQEVDVVRLGRRTFVTVASIEALIARNTVRRSVG